MAAPPGISSSCSAKCDGDAREGGVMAFAFFLSVGLKMVLLCHKCLSMNVARAVHRLESQMKSAC